MPGSTWNYLPTEKGQTVTKSGKDCRLQLNPPQESWSQGRFSSSLVHFELSPPSLLFAQLSPCPSIRAGQHNSKLSRSFHRVGLEDGLGLVAWSWPIWFGLVLVVWDCSRRVEHTITLHPHLISSFPRPGSTASYLHPVLASRGVTVSVSTSRRAVWISPLQ